MTPNCVFGTVTDALAYDFDVVLVDDAIRAQTPEVHEGNMFDMRNMGAVSMSVDEFVTTLTGANV